MSYYPILNAPGCIGWTTICNYSPNNWETRTTSQKFVNLTWADKNEWRTKNLGVLAPEGMLTVSMDDISDCIPTSTLPLLSLTNVKLPESSVTLPVTDTERTMVPAWRATLGLSTADATTSYQGEIDPFPAPGSLLTFSPFIQFGQNIENYLIFMNIEKGIVSRTAKLEIYDSAKLENPKETFEVRNNSATVICLDGLGFGMSDLPVVISKGMSGIPLYFSRTQDGMYLSLEHTHPPASYVIHGKRWEAQNILKRKWLSKVAQ